MGSHDLTKCGHCGAYCAAANGSGPACQLPAERKPIDLAAVRKMADAAEHSPSYFAEQAPAYMRTMADEIEALRSALQSIIDLDPPPAIGHAEPRIQTGLMWAVDIARGALK